MNFLAQDLRFAARSLVRNRATTLIAILTLSLGIGANAAIFTLVKSLVAKPLPYPDSEQLVMLWESLRQARGTAWGSVSYPNVVDWRKMNQAFENLSAFYLSGLHLTGADEPVRVIGVFAEPELFDVLRVKPAQGRTFLAEEKEPGKNRVVLLSHGLWHRRYAADPAIVGKTVGINGAKYIVVGVMPPEFRFPARSEAQLWVPLAITPGIQQYDARGTKWLEVVARMKRGVTVGAAEQNMAAVASRIEETYPKFQELRSVRIRTLFEFTYGPTAGVLLVVWGAVALVLLIACANVATMLLARATERCREVAVRFALGASRWRVVRLVMAECMLLTVAGGLCGLLAAPWTLDFLSTLEGNPLKAGELTQIDAKVAVFCLLVSVLAALICGAAPALLAGQTNVVTALKEGSESRGTLQKLRRSAWVVTEAGLALALLVGAAVISKSIRHLTDVNLGFSTTNLLTMRVSLPDTKYPEPQKRIQFYDRLQEKLNSLPGVRSAGLASLLPVQGCWSNGSYSIKGQPLPNLAEMTYIEHRVVSPGFFEAMGIPIIAGRQLEARDGRTARKATVISRRAVDLFAPIKDPVGQQMSLGSLGSTEGSVFPDENWRSVVGVVEDVSCAGPHLPPRATMYEPYWQSPVENMSVVVRSAVPPESLATTIRRAVQEIDADQPVYMVKTMEQILAERTAPVRFVAFVVSFFTVIALVLAAVGVFGVLSFAVSRSTHDIGVRLAMGARQGQVLWLVLRRGLMQVATGLGLGIPLSLIGAGLLRKFVYGILPPDLLTFLVAMGILVVAGALGSLIPAIRASRVEPMSALRHE
jgi:predicted permease